MRLRTQLLAGISMTAAERSKGRYMRAPDDHPAAGAPAADPPAADPPVPAADAPASEVPAADPPADGGFAAAFAEAAAPAAPAPAPDPAPKPDPAPAPAPAGGEPAPAPAAAPTPPAAPAAPAAPAMPTAEEIVAGLAKAIQAPPAPAAPAAPAPEPQQASLYNDEETTLIGEYQANWPDVAKAEQLVRRAEYHDLLKYVFTEVNRFIAPTVERVQAMGNTIHTSELKELVPDYTPLLETDVTAWIETQPNYLQGGMKQVMQSGTSDEVADLIGRYKAQLPPAAAPAPAPAPAAAPAAGAAPKPAAPKTELSKAAKQAAASLAPVGGERTQVPQGQDPQDYDTAFAKYAATMDS